ncbi:MAG TPA: transglycosylase SLT domain-containing protein [Gemmatimonadales bacterium]|nr:transglycosylase SLT domain-containing protein [Gemmatimonadales bacterium]
MQSAPPDRRSAAIPYREPFIHANSPSLNELDRIARPRRPFLVALAGTLLLGAVEFTPQHELATPSLSAVVSAGAPRHHPLDSASLEHQVTARYDYRPLARIFGTHTRDSKIAVRVARAIVREAGRLRVAPSLLAGVLLTENPRLEPETVSSQGAIGLMQVMRFHAGEFDCGSDDLRDVDANICHGAGVFGRYLERTGDVRRALLRYNGCVASTNTPNCHRYPAKVIQAAGEVRREMLRYREGG